MREDGKHASNLQKTKGSEPIKYIPPLEAMSHDCPVVCNNTISILEVVGNAGEYFDPADTGSMCAAIERVVESKSHQESLIAKGRARLELFCWDRCAAETFGVYMKLVKK